MSPLEFGAMAMLGLVGGLHCLQMCGPIVIAYSLPLSPAQARRAHALYNAGRILTYMLLGALAGAAGGALGLMGRLAGVQSGARIVSGAAMLVSAVLIAGFGPSGNGLTAIQKAGITARFRQAIARLLMAPGQKFSLGLILGFLPCGMLYAALLKAMETATALGGALTMLAFGLGTAAALVTIGMASSLVSPRLGRWSTRVAAVFVAATGAVLLWRGLMPPAPHHHG
jgi:uncharacterized protein